MWKKPVVACYNMFPGIHLQEMIKSWPFLFPALMRMKIFHLLVNFEGGTFSKKTVRPF